MLNFLLKVFTFVEVFYFLKRYQENKEPNSEQSQDSTSRPYVTASSGAEQCSNTTKETP
jgi:hypothetical protein